MYIVDLPKDPQGLAQMVSLIFLSLVLKRQMSSVLCAQSTGLWAEDRTNWTILDDEDEHELCSFLGALQGVRRPSRWEAWEGHVRSHVPAHLMLSPAGSLDACAQ